MEIFVSFPQTCNEYILLFTDQFLLVFVIPSVFILFRIGKDTSLFKKTIWVAEVGLFAGWIQFLMPSQ